MQTHLARGLSAAEAARAALDEEPEPRPGVNSGTVEQRGGLADAAGVLAQTLDDMDEPAAQAVLDRLLADYTVEAVLREVVLPYLHELGERWEHGEVSVAEEHFASSLLRGRLANLASWMGSGPWALALLACPPGERHDLPLLAFGIVLHRNGWRVSYVGADTPLEDVARTAAGLSPDLVVLTAVIPERFERLTPTSHGWHASRRSPSPAPAQRPRWHRPTVRFCSPEIRSLLPSRCCRSTGTVRMHADPSKSRRTTPR